jgi:hypothetical protein
MTSGRLVRKDRLPWANLDIAAVQYAGLQQALAEPVRQHQQQMVRITDTLAAAVRPDLIRSLNHISKIAVVSKVDFGIPKVDDGSPAQPPRWPVSDHPVAPH